MAKKNLTPLIEQLKGINPEIKIQKIVEEESLKIKKIQFSMQMTPSLLKQIKQRALDDNLSLKALVTNAVKSYLEAN